MPRILLFASLIATLPLQGALAQDSVVQQLLKSSFACPAEAYEYKKPMNYALKLLDRYQWEGDISEFKIRIERRRMQVSIRGVATVEETDVLSVKLHDIAVFLDDGVDVNIRCKGGEQCISVQATLNGQNDQYVESEDYFHACSASTASDIIVALRRLTQGS